MKRIDLGDTSNCMLGHRCESCGVEHTRRARLQVETAHTPMGVLCLTLCGRCAAYDGPPPITIGTAMRLVAQHADHLGITLDEMGEAMRCERGDDR